MNIVDWIIFYEKTFSVKIDVDIMSENVYIFTMTKDNKAVKVKLNPVNDSIHDKLKEALEEIINT